MTAPKRTSEKVSVLALIASSSGLLVEIISNAGKTVELLHKYFFLSLVLFWILTVAFAWITPLGPKRMRHRVRWLFTIGVSLLSLTILVRRSYEWYEHNKRITHPATPPEVRLPGMVLFPTVLAANNVLHLDSFYINQELSSFKLTRDHKFGFGPMVDGYVVDRDVYEAFKRGSCISIEGDKPPEAATTVLNAFWSKSGRGDLAAYLNKPDSLGRLIRERGDVFAQVIPTLEQLKGMSPSDYSIVKAWLHDCVGLYNPVFTLVISNGSDKDVILTKIVFHVLEVGQILGGFGGPIYPDTVYDCELKWAQGDQEQVLAPPRSLPARGFTSFNVRLHPDSKKHGISWWMNIEVQDSLGDGVKTPNFDLVMNKEGPK